MRPLADDRPLIVGAGIAGLALARALAGRGVDSSVVDRRVQRPDSGLGINLPGNAVRALGDLGLADQVAGKGVVNRRREYRNEAGRLLFDVDEDAFWGSATPSVCLRRGDLLQALNDPQRPPTWERVVTAVQVDDGWPVVRYADGTASTHPLVIGADGVHSQVRAAVDDSDVTRRSLMTDAGLRFMTANPGVDCWTAWSGREGTLLLIPVDADTVYGYAASTRGGAGVGGLGWLWRTFVTFAEPVPTTIAAVIDRPDQIHHAEIEEVRCPRWSRGRVTLVGDAAHAMGPIWAQGAALAIEDAIVLARLVAESGSPQAVGPEFERRRRARVMGVQDATDRMSKLARMPIRVRDIAAHFLGQRAYRAAYGPLREPYDTTDGAIGRSSTTSRPRP